MGSVRSQEGTNEGHGSDHQDVQVPGLWAGVPVWSPGVSWGERVVETTMTCSAVLGTVNSTVWCRGVLCAVLCTIISVDPEEKRY